MSEASRNRKRAPGQPQSHPDWILSLSGGVDSTAAAIQAIEALRSNKSGGNFAKAPFAIYLDTRVGVPLNRIYVEELADWLGVQLWTLRTNESFREWLERDGAPGGAAHSEVRNELKDRQISRLTTLSNNPVYVVGLAADESENRAGMSKVRERERHVEVLPVHRLDRKRRVEVVIRSGCPINPLWLHPRAIRDCGCLANGDPSELDKTEELFPKFAQRLREWEESTEYEGLKGTLGWDGLSAEEKRAESRGQKQTTLPMCGVGGCERQQNPAEARAFEVLAKGGSVGKALDELYGGQRGRCSGVQALRRQNRGFDP